MKLPSYRTGEYAIWRACERMGVRPPGMKSSWDELNNHNKATLIAYSQIREFEDNENRVQN